MKIDHNCFKVLVLLVLLVFNYLFEVRHIPKKHLINLAYPYESVIFCRQPLIITHLLRDIKHIKSMEAARMNLIQQFVEYSNYND